MKKAVVLLAVLAALGLSSCDMLFETNLFKDITHEDLAASDLATASPAEIEEYLASDEYKDQIASDPELKDAIIVNLEGEISAVEGDTGTASSELQSAAITVAQVYIETSPAAQVSTALLMELPNLMSGSETGLDVGTVVDSFTSALPPDIKSALDSVSPTPPQSFIDIIAAFSGASGAYLALGSDLDDGQTAAYNIPITDDQALNIAINAAISVLVASVQPIANPTPTIAEVSDALWSAILDPGNAGTLIQVDPGLQDFFDDTSGSYDPSIMNLLTAAGITF